MLKSYCAVTSFVTVWNASFQYNTGTGVLIYKGRIYFVLIQLFYSLNIGIDILAKVLNHFNNALACNLLGINGKLYAGSVNTAPDFSSSEGTQGNIERYVCSTDGIHIYPIGLNVEQLNRLRIIFFIEEIGILKESATPAKVGAQKSLTGLDSRFRWNEIPVVLKLALA